ncbi:30S ribosomal protein S3 [Desulfobulbus sp. F3]|uniref:30S ribosomal protein S3 n=1 Tax=Candidatus Electronema sp. TaxID=2698783 RepID=UPI003F0A40E2|nr:30S ribosomal protein S3 [Desulfobulbus sp. F3]
MGQKVNPIGLRLNITRTWDSIWYADKDYAANLHQDQQIRKYLKKKLYHAGVSRIVIERTGDKVRVKLFTARPGIVIGKKGAEIENLKKDIEQKFGRECMLDIQEVRRPEADAQLVAENITSQLEKRIAFRRAIKKAISSALRFGVKGIKISCSGRLGGAEMSRTEWSKEGRVPLHTLRADIDYGMAEASTTYGQIGVKVWIFKGEVLTGDTPVEQ